MRYLTSVSNLANGYLNDPYFMNSQLRVGSGYSSGGYGGGGGGGYYVSPTYVAGSAQTSSGLDMTNVALDLTIGNQPFNTQLNEILTSNSVIAKLLNSATKGDNSILINIGQLVPNALDPTGIAGNTHVSNTSQGIEQTITLDSDLVTSQGMIDLNYVDNSDVNHGSLTAVESLVATLAHEAFHAYLNNKLATAAENSSTLNEMAQHMLNNGMSEAELGIFFTATTNSNGEKVYSERTGNFIQYAHDYMKTSSFTYVNDAIAEYRTDH